MLRKPTTKKNVLGFSFPKGSSGKGMKTNEQGNTDINYEEDAVQELSLFLGRGRCKRKV